MIYDEKYDYEFINEFEFDEKSLLCKKDGSKYKKYIVIFYKENDITKSEEIPDESYINRFNNVLSTYEVEEIISSCTYFDDAFTYKKYYKIKDKFCFIKYKYDEDFLFLKGENDNEEIKKKLEELINR